MTQFRPVVPNADLSICEAPEQPWLAVACRWKDAHAFRKRHPGASVVGPMRTLRGIDLLFRSLLANPQITGVYLAGPDLTPDGQTTKALMETWSGDDSWLADDVRPYADLVRRNVGLIITENALKEHERDPRDHEPIVLPPPAPEAAATAPHGDPGQRVVADLLERVWPLALQQAMRFGRTAGTQYGPTRELLNLVSVIRNPGSSHFLPDWVVGHDQVEEYAHRLFVDFEPPEGAKYSYSSRLHAHADGEQIARFHEMLLSNPRTRAAFVTPWDPAQDAGLESGRPCLVGAWFRALPRDVSGVVDEAMEKGPSSGDSVALNELHLTIMFRSHDLYGAYPLNLASACLWLQHVATLHRMAVGTLTCVSCSAHIYERDWTDAEAVFEAHGPRDHQWDQRTTWRVELTPGVRCSKCLGSGEVKVPALNGYDYMPYGCKSCQGLGVTDQRLQATALTPDGGEVVGVFEGRTVQGVRTQIERSGLIQTVGNALWLGSELERVAKTLCGTQD